MLSLALDGSPVSSVSPETVGPFAGIALDRCCETRNGVNFGTVVNQFFGRGEMIAGTKYFYTLDHLGNIRKLTDATGAVKTRYSYDPYGQVTQTFVSGSVAADFQYAGYYYHAPSGLGLTRTRAYMSSLGRFINRDPIGETGGVNHYAYVSNNPISLRDSSGLISDSDAMNYIHQNNYSQKFSDAFLFCQYWKESSFNPELAGSGGGPAGFGQVGSGAFSDVAKASGIPYSYSQVYDVGINIQVASQYLDIRVDRAGGDLAGGVRGYGTTAPKLIAQSHC